jgi:bifunctional non-homologous end joining protein LigD
MLATPWPSAFTDPNWWFELKWDGVRTLLFADDGRVTLRSRRGLDVTPTYPEVSSIRIARPLVIDGEIVALDVSGRPSFQLLQQRMNLTDRGQIREAMGRAAVTYVVFDLLYDGGDITAQALEARRERLSALSLPAPAIMADLVDGEGEALFEAVRDRDLEGILAKRKGSPYQPGRRSPDWRKVANRRTLRAVVGGYLRGERARAETFGSLLVGLRDGPTLRWIGAVGSGFDDRSLVAIKATLDEIERDTPPFIDVSEVMGEPVWVEPALVAVVEFREWTAAGRLRAPVFKGFTSDRWEEVTWEAEGPEPR